MGMYIYMMQTKTIKTRDGVEIARGRYAYKPVRCGWMDKPSKFEAVTVPCMESYASKASEKLTAKKVKFMVNADKFEEGLLVYYIGHLHKVPDVYADEPGFPGYVFGKLKKQSNRWYIDTEDEEAVKSLKAQIDWEDRERRAREAR